MTHTQTKTLKTSNLPPAPDIKPEKSSSDEITILDKRYAQDELATSSLDSEFKNESVRLSPNLPPTVSSLWKECLR